MAILVPVEAKSRRGRLMHAMVTVALLVGGVTMVYPFLLMAAGSLRSPMDAAEMGLVPGYFTSEDELVRKFLEEKYNQDTIRMNRARGQQDYGFQRASVPGRVVAPRVADFVAFWEQANLPRHWQVLGGTTCPDKTVPANLRTLRERVETRFDGDLNELGRALGAPLENWLLIKVQPPDWLSPQYDLDVTPIYDEYFELQAERPLAERWPVALTGYFLEIMVYPRYGRSSVEQYNAAHRRGIASYHQFRLPRTVPSEDQPTLRESWIRFTTEELSPSFVRTDEVSVGTWRRFLEDRYSTIQDLNRVWSSRLTGFEEIDLPAERDWLRGIAGRDWGDFIETLDPERLVLVGPEFAWSDWLKHRYGDVAALNGAHEGSYERFADVSLPVAELEAAYVREHAGPLRWRYAWRNYVNVLDELVFQGRPLFNTLVFVTLSILLALLLNPLAAYAMSRFKLPGTYKILLILMATMAFPPMVALIPQFIALRELNLLNTFVALVLPVAVNGYLVFLLKGFFDSLPQELYEAATIDGAGELRMFFQIAMSLSKPILAVVALQAFNHAYLMFLYALVVAPDPDMWILSVWLYQYQQQASTAAVFASVIIASVPTLIIFLFAQRTIMKGIVVPTEK